MTLRTQMLVAAVLSLLLPLIGWQSVRELDASLREGRVDAQRLALAELELAVRAHADESTGVARRGTMPRTVDDLYAAHAPAPIEVDGYADDWRELPPAGVRIADERGEVSVRAAERRNRLYLMIDLPDTSRVYHRPPRLLPEAGEGELPDTQTRLANGDALHLFLAVADERQHAVLSPIAPGPLSAVVGSLGTPGSARNLRIGVPLDDWQAAWTERPGGYRVEVSMPLPDAGAARIRWGIAAIDVPAPGVDGRIRATLTPRAMQALHARITPLIDTRVPGLYKEDQLLRRLLLERVPQGARVRIYDDAGRLLADVDRLNRASDMVDAPTDLTGPTDSPFASLGDAILFRVFSFLVAGDLPLPERAYAEQRASASVPPLIDPAEPWFQRLLVTQRYVTPELDRVLGTVRASSPAHGGGWLWYETNEEHSSAYAGSRLARVFSLVFLASALASLLSFGWASWLSLRIRRLSRVTSRAVSSEGRVRAGGFPSSRARDEVGDLARDLARLLKRSSDYHRHLEALGGRLSHELNTPLAVVRSSLEILRGTQDPQRQRELLARAEAGAQELDRMIRALVDSTRLEQSLARASFASVSLDALLDDCRERHSLVERGVAIELERSPVGSPSPRLRLAPELIVQAIDKLVSNAIDFSIEPRVSILRRTSGARVFIGVANRAAPAVLRLDDATRRGWFEPMFSERSSVPGRVHLGLGLHLVALVAAHHGGTAASMRCSDRIAIGLWLPLGMNEGVSYYAEAL